VELQHRHRAGGHVIQSQRNRNPATKEPLAALDHVIEQVEPAIFVFKDFHPFLTKSNYAIHAQAQRDALHLKNSFKTIVLIAPVLEIPTELEKGNHGPESSAATRDDLSALLDRIIADVRQLKQVTVDLDDSGRERLLQAALG